MSHSKKTLAGLLGFVCTLPVAGSSQGAEEDRTLEEVIVTGVMSAAQSRLDAGFSITTANAEQIMEQAPISTADLLDVVPGLAIEATGGASGANVFVRGLHSAGDAPFLTVQVNGAPVFPAPALFFVEGTTLFRLDDMVQRVEVLRGGPSPVLGDGQPGVTANFIQRKGTDTFAGSIRGTYGSEGMGRADAWMSGPLSETLAFSVGGYYGQSDGLRPTQFTADKGGQLSATLTAQLGQADALTVYGRYADDHNAFYTGVPLIQNGRSISGIPGFDPLDDTIIGRDVQHLIVETGMGPQQRQYDLSDGRGVDLFSGGFNLDLELGQWSVADRFAFLTGNAGGNQLLTPNPPVPAGALIASFVALANSDPNVVAAAGGPATTGSASFFGVGQAVDPNQLVLPVQFWSADVDLESISNELRFTRELFAAHTVTIGTYFADYSSVSRLSVLGNNLLVAAEPNARRISIALDNGVLVTREGFSSAAGLPLNSDSTARNLAVFLADEWQINDAWRVDAGVRVERATIDSTVGIPSTFVGITADLDGDPTTLYNNYSAVPNVAFVRNEYRGTQTSYTAGANYRFTEDLSVFARFNHGFKFPQFDNLLLGQEEVQELEQYELGFNAERDDLTVRLTAFANDFTGIAFTDFVTDPISGAVQQVTSFAGSQAYGLELEGTFQFTESAGIDVQGTWLHAEYQDWPATILAPARTGNRVLRQPEWRCSVTPYYEVQLGAAALKLHAAYNYHGERFGDDLNNQPLPDYHTVDVGASVEMRNGLVFRLTGINVTDEFGLPEGNVLNTVTPASGAYFIGRPIFGAHWTLSVGYEF